MVLTTNGLNRIRSLFSADIYQTQEGTGTNAATSADTGLQTAVAATLQTPTVTQVSQAIQVTNTIGAGVGTSSDFTEHEVKVNSGSTSAIRVVHTALTKASLDQNEYVTTFFIKAV